MSLEHQLQELSTAEDFLEFFQIPYDGRVVQVYRLHILQKFHNYIAQTQLPATEAEQIQVYKQLLTQAYQDFVVSNAQKEQVFKVFRRHEPQEVLIAVDELLRS